MFLIPFTFNFTRSFLFKSLALVCPLLPLRKMVFLMCACTFYVSSQYAMYLCGHSFEGPRYYCGPILLFWSCTVSGGVRELPLLVLLPNTHLVLVWAAFQSPHLLSILVCFPITKPACASSELSSVPPATFTPVSSGDMTHPRLALSQ